MERFTESLGALDKAIEFDPQYASAWNNKGYALEQLDRQEEADVCYKKAAELGV